MREFFELAAAGRFEEAHQLLHGDLVTFPLYRADQPVLRGARPMMERLAAFGEAGVSFRFDEYIDLGDGFVLANGVIGSATEHEPSHLLCGVLEGRIATVEAHVSEDAALAAIGRNRSG